jgi:hypothetical protein
MVDTWQFTHEEGRLRRDTQRSATATRVERTVIILRSYSSYSYSCLQITIRFPCVNLNFINNTLSVHRQINMFILETKSDIPRKS